jgi:ABC-2 type transport system permease protein
VVFAGEYGWNTWKLIVPHRARNSLIAAKYVVALALLACGFVLGAILFNLSSAGSRTSLTGDPIPAGIAAGALLQAHALAALAALAPILLTTAYVSLAAILTRSTVAALVIGFVITTVEQLFRVYAPMLAAQRAGLVGMLYQALPGYHLGNLGYWLSEGRVLVVPFPSGPFSMAPAASLAIVAAWTLGLTALTFRIFRRQDIN